MRKLLLSAVCLLLALHARGTLAQAQKKPLETGAFTASETHAQTTEGSPSGQEKSGEKIAEGTKVDAGTKPREITFADSSVMRMGPNSLFSFDSKERLIRLDKGTILMHVPPGNGGISIEGGGVVGNVSGSTVMASSDGNGNFAFAVLESDAGAGQITNKDGSVTSLTPGQMGVVSANRPGVSTSFEVNVTALMESSPLFTEFTTPMPGNEKVTAVAEKQGREIESGTKVLEKTPNADEKSARAEDPAVEAFASLTGLTAEECAQAPNLILEPFQGGEGQQPTAGTLFTMNTDAGGEVSARVASGAAEFVPAGSSTGVQIGSNQGFSSSTGQVASLPAGDSFTGNVSAFAGDARSADGKAVASSSAQPGGGSPGDVATAAGGEGPGGVETAAGGGGGADTQSPLAPAPAPAPVGGGVTVDPPEATPTGATT